MKRLHQIYNGCFPKLKTTYAVFSKKIGDDVHTISARAGKNVVGFSLIYKNAILLLCVLLDFQRQGYGAELLKQSEAYIQSQGFDEVILGAGTGKYLLPGVPMNDGAHLFFENCGYHNSWKTPCIDLVQDLGRLDMNTPKCDGIQFGYAKPEQKEALLAAVQSVEPKWVAVYRDTINPVLIATDKDRVIGFVELTEQISFAAAFDQRVGGIGALGVVPEYRKRGVGRCLVSLAGQELRKRGVEVSYVAYTYLEKFYKSLGYQVYMNYWMGRKNV